MTNLSQQSLREKNLDQIRKAFLWSFRVRNRRPDKTKSTRVQIFTVRKGWFATASVGTGWEMQTYRWFTVGPAFPNQSLLVYWQGEPEFTGKEYKCEPSLRTTRTVAQALSGTGRMFRRWCSWQWIIDNTRLVWLSFWNYDKWQEDRRESDYSSGWGKGIGVG